MTAARRITLAFDRQCAAFSLPPPVAEHRFHETRRWRFDFAWPDHRVALEIAGGVKQRLLRMAMDARRRAGWPDGRGMVDVRP